MLIDVQYFSILVPSSPPHSFMAPALGNHCYIFGDYYSIITRILSSQRFPFFKDCIYLFLEKGKGREKERERNINVWVSHAPPTGDLAHNPGLCPDWESNPQP